MLVAVASEYPGVRLHLIMGADSLRDFPAWRRPADILALCRLAVAGRPGVEIDLGELSSALPGAAATVDLIHAPWVAISATDIRQRVASGRTVRFHVPEPVEAYIHRHRLYRT
jgi:nicotinate-nucleotide adenylyltransferase